jgi:hypothetical protein
VARRALDGPGGEAAVRGRTGELLGRDFSGVRFHTGAAAADETRADGAHAVTRGRDVYFAPGRFRPDHPLGRALIAHELTHVAQQRAAPPAGGGAEGELPAPGAARAAIDGFRATHPEDSMAARRAELADPGPGGGLTPAPRGMRQRCLFGCKSDDGKGEGRDAGEPLPGGVPEPPEPTPEPKPEPEAPEGGTTGPPEQAQQAEPEEPAETEAPDTAAAGQASPAALGAVRVAGAATPDEPYKVIRLAWTMDDGPTPATSEMKKKLGDIPTTWFIMRNQLGSGATQTTNLNDLKDLEAKGHEIAIHSSHPDQAHVSWFPVKVAAEVPKAYNDVSEATAHLTEFTKLLRDNGLHPKFVRLPGGLASELSAYLKAKGVADEALRDTLVRKIARQESVAGESEGVRKVAADYDTIRTTLDTLKLNLWGGSASGPTISALSWEAESSGSGLTDNVTDKFKGLVDEFSSVHRVRWLIVLAHDTNDANAKEVKADVDTMEAYAAANGVQIRYYTVAGLWQQVRGSAP